MNLKQSYEFLGLIVEGEIETWEARDRATGKRVLVHLLLAGDTATNKANVERISDLCKQNHELIAVGLDAEIPFVVTGTAFGSVGLREWSHIAETAAMPTQVWHRSPPPPPRQAEPKQEKAPQAKDEANAPGEFTRIFQAPQDVSRPAQASSIAPERPEPDAPSQPGEFTRFFQSPYSSQPSEKPAPNQSPVPPSLVTRPSASPAGSEFTQVFQRSAATLPADHDLGSFTQVFGSPAPPAPKAPVVPEVKPPAPAAGDFTRIFSPSARATPDPASIPENKVEPSHFSTRYPSAPPVRPAIEPIVPPVVPPSGAGPGDYTRLVMPAHAPKFQAPAEIAPKEIPAPKIAMPKAKKPPTQFPILAVLLGLLLLAILVVIFFAIRR
jgi:hypothetical protein